MDNSVDRKYGNDLSQLLVHHLFEQQAVATPGASAIVFGNDDYVGIRDVGIGFNFQFGETPESNA